MNAMSTAQLIEEYTAIFNACASLDELNGVVTAIEFGILDGTTVAALTAAHDAAYGKLAATETLDRAVAKSVYITDAMVETSRTLRAAALHIVRNYTGFNTFVQDVAIRLADRGALSAGQMRGALNIAVSEEKTRRAKLPPTPPAVTTDQYLAAIDAARAASDTREALYLDIRTKAQKTADDAGEAPSADDAPQAAKHTPNGTYTIILNREIDEYRTIRLEDAPETFNAAPGTQIASFLSGADNEGDYTGFAFVMGDVLRVWKKYRNNAAATKSIKALNMLITSDDPMAAMREYVLRSSRCGVCNRKLTTPDSIRAGIEPICRGKLADQGFTFELSPAQRADNAARAAMLIDELFPE